MARVVNEELVAIAAAQYGVVATHQARSLASSAVIRRAFEGSHWRREARSVYGVAGAHRSSSYRTMAALLQGGPGAVLSHESALWLWSVLHREPAAVHITRMRAANGSKLRRDRIVAHETRRMPAAHVTVHRSFPVVTPARALIDVAATAPMGRVARLLDRAWMLRLVDYPTLRSTLVELDKRGRRGIKPMWLLLTERGPDFVPPESGLEGRLNRLLSKAGLPSVERQVDVGGEAWLGRVDFRLGTLPLVIEVQSDMFHRSLTSAADDARRAAAMEEAGFSVLEIWESALWSDPGGVVADVVAAMREVAR